MFTPEERTRLRDGLLAAASADPRVTSAAITGSASQNKEDRWSDVDLAFGIDGELQDVLRDWTDRMYADYRALHHVDVHAGAWHYRVFLLAGTLQVDLAFVTQHEFRALAPTFRLIFGTANDPRQHAAPAPDELIGMGWLHALHARTSIARGKLWQAEYMISRTRDHALALACLRHSLPVHHGRGVDDLPADARSAFEDTLIRRLEVGELSRAFRGVMEQFLVEVRFADRHLENRLECDLRSLTEDLP
jgi:hypothetical protein